MSLLNLNAAEKQTPFGSHQKKCAPAAFVFKLAAEQMAEAGLGMPDIIADDNLHRFKLPDETKGKSGWYVCHADGIPCVIWGSWKHDLTRTTSGIDPEAEANASVSITEKDIAAAAKWIEACKAERALERQKASAEASVWSRQQWDASVAPSADHPYLVKKHLKSGFNARQNAKGALVIPLWNAEAQLTGVQRILPDGSKLFPAGLVKSGLYSYIPEGSQPVKENTVLICEGWATGCSLSEATGCAVVVALDAGNLPKVAPVVREKCPSAEIIICADNDRWTKRGGAPWNPGLEYAEKAAKACGGSVVSPEFASLDGKPTDFNDLCVREGAEAVRGQVTAGSGFLRLDDWDVSIFEGEAPKQEWLVEGLLPMAAPCLLAAYGGTGKGMLALDLALTVAGRKSTGFNLNLGADMWMGSRVVADGTAVILSAEDTKDDIHRRLCALDPTGKRREAAKGRLKIVALPNAGGPFSLVQAQQYHQGYEVTDKYRALLRDLKRFDNLKLLNIDPLASFTGIDVNTDSQGAQYFQGQIARLAEETGACVLVAHHMSKGKDFDAMTADGAREAVRGSTALVDGVRCTLCVWPVDNRRYGALKKRMGGDAPVRRSTFCAAVVKSNAPADMSVRLLSRNKTSGLLEEVSGIPSTYKEGDLKRHLAYCVGIQAAAGYPFSFSGSTSIYQRRATLPIPFSGWTRSMFKAFLEEMEGAGLIVRCTHGKSQAKYYDIPTGPLATGDESWELAQGASSVVNPPLDEDGGAE